jgi:hypothetical protein
MTKEEFLRQLDSPDARLFAAARTPPWATAVIIFATLFALFVLIREALDYLSASPFVSQEIAFWGEADTAIILSILLGYLYAADIYRQRGATRNIEELEARLDPQPSEEVDETFAKTIIRRRNIAIWGGIAVGLLYVLFLTGSGALFLTEQKVEGFFIFALFVFPALFSQAGQTIAIGNPLLSMFFHQHKDQFRPDVFDRDAHEPFVQFGMRSALLWLFLFGILTLLLLDEGNNRTIFGSLPMLYVMVALSAVVATYEFLSPLVMARFFIKREKASELEWVVERIKDARAALRDPSGSGAEPARPMADLIAYKQQIDRLSDWPVDSPDIGRFIIYLLIPALSWFSAVGAEIMVEIYFAAAN